MYGPPADLSIGFGAPWGNRVECPPDLGGNVGTERILIVNGDDFGLSHEVNEGIERAHQDGVLTSTSLMVNGPAFEDAVARARRLPHLGVGLHLALVETPPTLPASEWDGALEPDGRFPFNPAKAGFRYWFRRGLRDTIGREVRAQLDRFRSTGLPCTHIDGHMNLQVHPVVREAVLAVAKESGVRWVRAPWDDLGLTLRIDASGLPLKVLHAAFFRPLSARVRKRAAEVGVRTCDGVHGVYQSGRIDARFLCEMLARLGPGVRELYAHPRLDASGPNADLAALSSPSVREAVDRAGFRLAHFGEVA